MISIPIMTHQDFFLFLSDGNVTRSLGGMATMNHRDYQI